MTSNHFDTKVGKFLNSFAAGKSVPGSGCGAAFQVLLNAKMIITHIKLSKSLVPDTINTSEFERLQSEVEQEVDKLEKLYCLDYKLFSTYRKKIKEAKSQNNIEKETIELEINKTLEEATTTLLNIAKSCLILMKIAITTFEVGYEAAAGESGLPMISLLGIARGCFLISHKNLGDLECNSFHIKTIREIEYLEGHTNKLTEYVEIERLKIERQAKIKSKINTLRFEIQKNKSPSDKDIFKISREFQKIIWKHRTIEKSQPLELFNPESVLKNIDYRLLRSKSLGQSTYDSGRFETAGLINTKQKYVAISEKFSLEQQRFTLAHEIGHLVLGHKITSGDQIHRDRPISKSSRLILTDPMERQANKFASQLLMPEKMVRDLFVEIFGTERFVLNEDTVFGLGNIKNTTEFNAKFKEPYHIARFISSLNTYNGRSFTSFKDLFQVSIETMAIRLIELDLV